MPVDWQQFHATEVTTPAVVDPRRRMRICLAALVTLLAVVFGRAVQLEVTQGPAFREKASTPLVRQSSLPGVRGRILARDGAVLAHDRRVRTLAVHYRYLQRPPDPQWLRRLAALCNLSPDEWNRRAGRIRNRVQRIAESVKRRRGVETTVTEQLDYHVMAEDVPSAAVDRIEEHPDRYPGVKILWRTRRSYPSGTLAAHVLGHLGRVAKGELNHRGEVPYHAEDLVGRAGLESQYEQSLRAVRGVAVTLTDRSGRVLLSYRKREPGDGRDLVLTLDPKLQQTAETLLDAALKRQSLRKEEGGPAGGAVVVMDVADGAIRAAASAPRFDPNLFDRRDQGKLAALLVDPAGPLFDRVSRMAIPPGSVFKTVSAAALLESGAVDPEEAFVCRGYLHRPDRQRCAIYVRRGVGHGEVTLADALCVSCNVYFFHHCGELGPKPLLEWAFEFGFGRPTGVDLPGEAAGMVPTPASIHRLEGHAWRTGDTQLLGVGQGSLTATPLQVVRMMAAVANGGRLVTPHFAKRGRESFPGEKTPVPFLGGKTLEAIRRGLRRVVSDPDGTAHGTLYLESISIAGKTGTAQVGTAQTGTGRAAHAWLAAYVPAEEPRFALVVVLEHSGDAAAAAGPVAKRLVLRMEQLGYFP